MKTMKHSTYLLVGPAIAILLGLSPDLALAACDVGSESLGAVACHISSNFDAFLDLVGALAYIGGVIFGIKAALQLKDHTDSPQQTKLSKPLTSLAVSAFLLSLPGILLTGLETFYGTGGGLSSLYNGIGGGSGGAAPAATDLSSMFVALSYSLPAMVKLVSLGSRLLGVMLMVKTIYMLPQLEQGRETGSKVLWTLVSAIALYSFPILFGNIMETMGSAADIGNPSFGNGNPLTDKYKASGAGGFDGTISAVLMFVQLLGVIAFVRGTLILKAIGENKDGTMGRALTHIFGGAAAMNITWAVTMLANTIGAHQQICVGISKALCLSP